MSDLRERPEDQPLPTPNERPSIQSLVRADLDERERLGVRRYGTPLQPFNGRDAARDLYEELLDAACYARQLIEEGRPPEAWRSVDVDGRLSIEDEAERIVEAFVEGDRVLWNPSNGNVESATVQSVNLLIRLDDNGDELVVEGRHCRAATQPGDFEAVEVECETVLSWHPVTADPSEPIEVPLNEHVAWMPEELGEFRVSTREVGPADEVPEGGASCLS